MHELEVSTFYISYCCIVNQMLAKNKGLAHRVCTLPYSIIPANVSLSLHAQVGLVPFQPFSVHILVGLPFSSQPASQAKMATESRRLDGKLTWPNSGAAIPLEEQVNSRREQRKL